MTIQAARENGSNQLLIAQAYCASRAKLSAIVPKYNIALRKNGRICRKREETTRGENESKHRKYETRDGLAVRSARRIFADRMLSDLVVRTEPGCASRTSHARSSSTYRKR